MKFLKLLAKLNLSVTHSILSSERELLLCSEVIYKISRNIYNFHISRSIIWILSIVIRIFILSIASCSSSHYFLESITWFWISIIY